MSLCEEVSGQFRHCIWSRSTQVIRDENCAESFELLVGAAKAPLMEYN